MERDGPRGASKDSTSSGSRGRASTGGQPVSGRLDGRGQLSALVLSDRWSDEVAFLGLSPRERQIIECILSGIEGDGPIGERLGMPSRTVHTHLERLYRKLRVTSRSQLLVHLFVVYATRADSGGEVSVTVSLALTCRPTG